MDTTAADPMRAATAALRVLEEWEQHPPAEVLDAVWAAPAHLQRALAGQWWALSRLDRADLYALRTAAEDLAEHGPAALEADGAARLDPIISECRHFAAIVEPDPQYNRRDRQRTVRRAASNLAAYRRLGPDQQAAVLTLLTPPSTTSDRLLGALTIHIPPLPDPAAGALLDTVLSEAAKRAAAGDGPAMAPARLGYVMGQALGGLPREWQQQVMRRIGDGLTPLDAVGAAVRAHKGALRQGGPHLDADGPQGA